MATAGWRDGASWHVCGWRRCWIAEWGDAALPGCCWKSPSGCACWGIPLVGAVNPAGPDGPVVAGGPVGPCETLSPSFYKSLEPLEHSVLDHADPAGQHAAVGPVGPFGMLSSSDCHPAGPYVAGGPVGPDDLFKVLEPLEHSVLDHADPAGQHAVVQDVLELLEHSVLDTILDGEPMEGITCPEPLEHTVLDMTLDGGLLEKMSDWEPVVHSVLDATLDGRPMEGIPDPEPLENLVLVMALDSGLTEGMLFLEPLEHSVLNTALVARPIEGTLDMEPLEHSVLTMTQNDQRLEVASDCVPLRCAVRSVALDGRPMEGIPDLEPLEHLVLEMALDSGLTEGISKLEPLEHSVLNVHTDNIIAEVHNELMFGSGSGWSFIKFTDAMRKEALSLRAAVPLPAGDVGCVTLSPVEGCTGDSDMCVNNINLEGFQRWNTDRDILDQNETFNGLPVYYGGDLYDSEDSERDDPYALASAAYVEDYNFDVPEGMDLMVHCRIQSLDGSGTQRDDQADMVPVCQMVSCVTRNGWDVFNDASWTEAADVDDPNIDNFYQWAVSSG